MSHVSPNRARLGGLIDLYRDNAYFSEIVKLGIPIALQQVLVSLLNMVGVIMVGQKGETAVAAVGLAGQVFFLLNLVLFGIGSGSAIFTAQLWGKKDVPNLRKVLSLCLGLSSVACIVFFALSEWFPSQILGIYSQDPQVIRMGSDYLRLFAWSFIFFTVTYIYSIVLRSTGEVRLPMFVSIAALGLNVLLTYALIFGVWGLPALGVTGAALAAVISRVLECICLLTLTYKMYSPVAAGLHELLVFDFRFVIKVLKPVLPVALNEFMWSMGITAYNVIYARIGTGSIAAINMIATIDNLAFSVVTGIGSATAIMVGHRIGSGQEDSAYRHAGRSLGLSAAIGASLGGLALLGADHILELFKVSPIVLADAQSVLIVFSMFLWLRSMNTILVVGVLRSGGDTRFCLVLDGFIIWIVGVPLAFAGAFIFHLPVYWVYLLAMSEEVTKWALGLFRYFSRKWIHNLARTVSAD